MTSSKINIETVKKDADSLDTVIKNFVIEDNTRNSIALAIQLSKDSKVPMMIIGNPGEGKTATVDDYARQNGYHVEKLIGSQYAQDDILGYQVNVGEDYLKIIPPNWYKNIMEKHEQGIPSILFLDELVTASIEVQEALLNLTSERTIRNNNKLPDDCIIISAVNYKENLPPENNLTSTQLNRFCIVNTLMNENSLKDQQTIMQKQVLFNDKWIEDVTQGFSSSEIRNPLPTWTNTPFTPKENQDFLNDFRNFLKNLFLVYSDPLSDKGILDLRNTSLDGMYESHSSENLSNNVPEVWNFISKRTISYLMKVTRTLCEIGVNASSTVWHKFVDGLIGLGTNSFNTDDTSAWKSMVSMYHKECYQALEIIIDKYTRYTNPVLESKDISKEDSDKIKAYTESELYGKVRNYLESTDEDTEVTEQIIKDFNNVFPMDSSIKNNFISLDSVLSFRSNYEALKLFTHSGKFCSLCEINSKMNLYKNCLVDLIELYEFYYNTAFNTLGED